jgi:peptide/nickel transport system permease protein
LGLSNKELRSLRGSEIAMISQQPMVALDPLFTVQYQLTKPIRRLRGVGASEAKRIAAELLEQVGIVDVARVLKTHPHQLSGGMAQRVSIALALTGEPELLVADEPTTALDVTVQAEILSLLRHLVETTGLSIVIVSHDLGVVADICDAVAVMYAGEVVESGATEDVLENPAHPYTMALLAANPHVAEDVPVPVRLASINGTVPPPGQWPTGCRFAGRCQFAQVECSEPFAPAPSHGTGMSRCVRSDELTTRHESWEPEHVGDETHIEDAR